MKIKILFWQILIIYNYQNCNIGISTFLKNIDFKYKQYNNKYCPGDNSCCNLKILKKFYHNWDLYDMKNIIKYYNNYINNIKYIMNNYEYFFDFAKYIKLLYVKDDNCSNFANKILEKKITKKVMNKSMYLMENTLYNLNYIRKGFYCLLCEPSYNKFFDIKNKEVIFSKRFCEDLVFSTIKGNYFKVKYIFSILSDINNLLKCNKNGKIFDNLMNEFDDFRGNIKIVKECYKEYTETKQININCWDYCRTYNIINPNQIIDSNYNLIKIMKTKIYNLNNANKIYYNPVFEDVQVKNHKDIELMFFKNIVKNEFEYYKTKIDSVGINLFAISLKSKFLYLGNNTKIFIFIFFNIIFYLI